jgi:hypothetical protein
MEATCVVRYTHVEQLWGCLFLSFVQCKPCILVCYCNKNYNSSLYQNNQLSYFPNSMFELLSLIKINFCPTIICSIIWNIFKLFYFHSLQLITDCIAKRLRQGWICVVSNSLLFFVRIPLAMLFRKLLFVFTYCNCFVQVHKLRKSKGTCVIWKSTCITSFLLGWLKPAGDYCFRSSLPHLQIDLFVNRTVGFTFSCKGVSACLF